ncbi:MAG: hypothetical protein JF571_01270 [Asticcacaulis sp.]|nr:hypothetical protein [Asticcacaulis sp.]
MTRHPPKLREVLPWLALGPVTGLLAWRMCRCFRDGELLLASFYALAILGFWIDLIGGSGQALAELVQ